MIHVLAHNNLMGVPLRKVNGTQISCLQTSEVEVENAAQFFHLRKPSVVALCRRKRPRRERPLTGEPGLVP
jgi:hypothetical protein